MTIVKHTDEANAHLIADAPSLLHACELAAEELNKMGCTCESEDIAHCPVCAVNAAVAAAKLNQAAARAGEEALSKAAAKRARKARRDL